MKIGDKIFILCEKRCKIIKRKIVHIYDNGVVAIKTTKIDDWYIPENLPKNKVYVDIKDAIQEYKNLKNKQIEEYKQDIVIEGYGDWSKNILDKKVSSLKRYDELLNK